MNWDTISTCTSSTSSTPLDFKKILTIIREMDAARSFSNAMRDVYFEDMRARGLYIKAERDACGEYWVVDDGIVERLKQLPKDPVAMANPFGMPCGVRIMPLSAWLLREELKP